MGTSVAKLDRGPFATLADNDIFNPAKAIRKRLSPTTVISFVSFLVPQEGRHSESSRISRFDRFHKLSTEFAVIVAGVLVALNAENWWSERSERIDEMGLSEDMEEEFRENLVILQSDIETNLAVIAEPSRFSMRSDDEWLSMPDSAFDSWTEAEVNLQ